MGIAMIVRIGDNIISSLGFTTKENYQAVKSGRSGLKRYNSCMGIPEPFVASLIDKEQLNERFAAICPHSNACTPLEKAAILSVGYAVEDARIDLANPRVLFIFSSTKGNVDLLENEACHCGLDPQSPVYLWKTANTISQFFGNPNTPVVVSNACISGVAAQIAAMRELESGLFDYAVVIGADMLSKFIISGFQSFKALSPEPCKPFDKERCGLNLGEAAATIIYSTTGHCELDPQSPTNRRVILMQGAIRNDANHISAPSRVGEGSLRALNYVLSNTQNLTSQVAFINAHGTATPYNDNMESVAIARAGLEAVPINSLKGYYGHTLGAAGVLESIISMHALLDDTILPTQGFENNDDDCSLNIAAQITQTKKSHCLKMLSGFGGCNAALLFQRDNAMCSPDAKTSFSASRFTTKQLFIKKYCLITPQSVLVNGKEIPVSMAIENGKFLTSLYRSLEIDYPKFFKMDNLSKLGFLTSELIFREDKQHFVPREDLAIICFNRSSSLESDTLYQTTIQRNEDYFPSPSIFVYTLPNIVTGEIAIRNKLYGETSFYICKKMDAEQLFRTTNNAFQDKTTRSVLAAWIESFEERYEAFMMLVESAPSDIPFSIEQINRLYKLNKE
jgi:3-oxoacyl-[acyl-carrier-protein] synthase-1